MRKKKLKCKSSYEGCEDRRNVKVSLPKIQHPKEKKELKITSVVIQSESVIQLAVTYVSFQGHRMYRTSDVPFFPLKCHQK